MASQCISTRVWRMTSDIRLRSLIIPVILLAGAALADTATQTDWSGASGVWGPVLELGTDYSWDTGTNTTGYPGDLQLGYINDIVVVEVVTEYDGATSVRGADIDGDGDMDVLGVAVIDIRVDWWENLDGIGGSWVDHPIEPVSYGVTKVRPTDVDGDGDLDVVGNGDDTVFVWKNLDGLGTSWERITIGGFEHDGGTVLDTGDLDGDGDPDVVTNKIIYSSRNTYFLLWFENLDGTGESWAERIIDPSMLFWGSWVECVDLDLDGDVDVLKDVYWYENADGSGTDWIRHTFTTEWGGHCVHASDLDGDGDLDVVGAYNGYESAVDVCWFENQGFESDNWLLHVIDNDAWGANAVWTADFDHDGDMDVAGAIKRQANKKLVWWENVVGDGTVWNCRVVHANFGTGYSVHVADFNGDGDPDILGAGYVGGRIIWADLLCHPGEGILESSVLDTQTLPLWTALDFTSSEPGGTDVGVQVRASADPDSIAAAPWSDMQYAPCSLDGILEDSLPYVQYRVTLFTSDQDTTPTLQDVTLSWTPTGIEGEEPSETCLQPVLPNPVRGAPVIRFGMEAPGPVALQVFDLSGRIVWKSTMEMVTSGEHAVSPGIPLIPGMYFCRMTAGTFLAVERFLVID